MRQKLQNSKGYAESLEFLPALGLFIFKKKSVNLARLRTQVIICTVTGLHLCRGWEGGFVSPLFPRLS